MKRTVLAATAALLVCSTASAQKVGIGIDSMQAGGGISDFTGAAASALTKLGAEWDLRLGMNLNLPISLEFAYVGSTHPTNDVMGPLAGGASFLANGVEGLVRYDFTLRLRLSPFLFGGAGWDHWSLGGGGARSNPLAVEGSDNTMTIPFGGGVEYPITDHWDVDGRFTYRTTLLDELLQTNGAGQPNAGAKSLTTWTMTARVGYLF
jgi:opacity protein-like surface antigen